MKKLFGILLVVVAFGLAGCTNTSRSHTPPSADELPTGFEYVRDAGNGYFLFTSPVGYFLVSEQIQGALTAGYSNRFIDMVFLGKNL